MAPAVILLTGLTVMPTVHAAAPATYESPATQVSVLELYTSHGCSSCPPADAWLSTLRNHPGLWHEFIPLAFHVDYWDDLGWPDRFASRAYSERQRDFARKGRLATVYTPGFVLRGDEWRGWFRGQTPALASQAVVGRLTLGLQDATRATLRFTPETPVASHRLTAHLAVLGFGIASEIGAGENRGRTLDEDFVVLGYTRVKQSSVSDTWTVTLPDTVPAATQRRAVVAWVSVDADPAPWQAVGGWLPPAAP